MKPLIYFLLIQLLTVQAKKVLSHNLELVSQIHLLDKKHTFNAIQLFLGTGNESTHSPVSFFLNIGQSQILIGEKSTFNSGIDCKDSTKNSCEFAETPKTQRFYFSKEFTVLPAKAFWTLTKETVSTKDPEIKKMPFELISSGNNWFLKDWGVIGFAPQGEVSKYLSQIYEGPVSILPHYTKRHDQGYDLRAYLNPLYLESQVAKKVDLTETETKWTVMADLDLNDPEFGLKNTPLCINTLDEEIFQVADGTDMCNAVKKLICDGKIGKLCTKKNSDFSKANKIVISISGNNFEFLPKEYLYYNDKDIVSCRIGDVVTLRSAGVCENNAEAGIGLGFFEKYPVVFEIDFGKKSSVRFLNEFNDPSNYGLGFKALVILGIAIFIIGGYLIYKTVGKSKKNDEDYEKA